MLLLRQHTTTFSSAKAVDQRGRQSRTAIRRYGGELGIWAGIRYFICVSDETACPPFSYILSATTRAVDWLLTADTGSASLGNTDTHEPESSAVLGTSRTHVSCSCFSPFPRVRSPLSFSVPWQSTRLSSTGGFTESRGVACLGCAAQRRSCARHRRVQQ